MLEQSSIPDVSVIIPAYDEEKTIADVLQGVIKVSGSLGQVEIIVVDDGSTDRTGEIAMAFPSVMYIRHEHNMGKGAAIRTGIENSSGKILVIQDADLEYLPDCIPSLFNFPRRWDATPTTPSPRARSARWAWPSTRSTTWRRCSTRSRSTRSPRR